MSKNERRRAPVVLPVDDKLVGKRDCGTFLTELAQRDIKLRRQREALRETAGAWKDENHPELSQGAAAWVREVRSLEPRRFEELEQRRGSE